jgi:hypothetical protein
MFFAQLMQQIGYPKKESDLSLSEQENNFQLAHQIK